MSNPLAPTEADIKLMLAAKVHVGTRNCDPQMERYIWKRKNDGIYIINLGKTWEKLMLAARVIVAIENSEDVVAISARPYGQRAVLKFAQHTGANYIAGRYTPGTFTNQIQRNFLEPRLLVVTDPRTDSQPVKEASYVNIPTIAFCDSDSPTTYVDLVIPANNKGKQSIALIYWLLACEVNRLRAAISRAEPWEVMVDLFMYRDPEEAEKESKDQDQKAEDLHPETAVADVSAPTQYDTQYPADDEFAVLAPTDWNQAEQAAVPTTGDFSGDLVQANWNAPTPQGWGDQQ